MRATSRGAYSVRRRGWIPVQKADIALLIEQCGESAATTCMTWIALLIIANDRRSTVFKIGINVIRYLAGPSLRTVKTALNRLVELGFLKIEPNRMPDSKERDANTYVLLRGGKIDHAKSVNNCTTGRVSDDVLPLHGSSEESASALEQSASAREELATAGSAANAAASTASTLGRSGRPRKW
jgi:hypothetical protein